MTVVKEHPVWLCIKICWWSSIPIRTTNPHYGEQFDAASTIGGKIKAFLPIYDFSYEMTTLLSPDERTAMRQA